MLIWLSHDVTLIEIERKPPEEENYMMEHLLRVTTSRNQVAGNVAIWPKPIGCRVGDAQKFDVVFALSTLCNLDASAYMDCLNLVKLGGLLFVTTSDKRFNQQWYEMAIRGAMQNGFNLAGGVGSYDWDKKENNFASLAMIKEKE